MTIATSGAICKCLFGTVPCPINVVDVDGVCINGKPVIKANNVTNTDIPTFGMCFCPNNPLVTILGPLVIPTICTPQIITPPGWIAKKMTVKISEQSPCSTGDTCMCKHGGIISILINNQATVS